ncbi:MAG: hypothetical protein R6U04_03000 [Bacteroidales bacterium]
MKTRLTIITSLLLGIFIFSGCGSEETTPENLDEDIKMLQELEERSGNIENKEEAFTLLRDLNQTMKSIRDKLLSMDAVYREASDEEKKRMEEEFEEANEQMDASLKVIRENIDPYKDGEEVSKMIEKLNEIMISK